MILEEWLLEMARIGYGRTRMQLKIAVKKILDKDMRQNIFKDNMPGNKWVRTFLKRHPRISIRQAESLPVCRARGCSREILDKWFKDFEDFLRANGLYNKADRIWNADESGFPLQFRTG